VKLDIKTDLKEAQRYLRELGPGVDRAAARAINDVLTTLGMKGRQAMKKENRALKIGDIKANMKTTKANRLHLGGSIEVSGKPLSLLLFKPKQFKLGTKAIMGNVNTLLGSEGRRVFHIPDFGGEYFIRKAAGGRSVRRFRGVSLPGAFRAREDEFMLIARTRWETTFPNRLTYEIEKARALARGTGK